MQRQLIGSFVLFLAVAAVVLRPWEKGPEAGPATATVRVVRVIDGDTIVVRLAGREEDVRLIGVDTPETVKPDTPVQCFGERASHFTKRALTGRRVRLVFGVERHDVYGRLLAYVYLARRTFDGSQHVKDPQRDRLFNSTLVRRGLARSLTIPPNDRFAPRFRRLELAAARDGRGLWSACSP
ncbi:MAG TPA: thermonuclease family protein [Solirubrobacterales bacterium]|nr:thermonuclease family protein [Solirubrobacterales bacterium]